MNVHTICNNFILICKYFTLNIISRYANSCKNWSRYEFSSTMHMLIMKGNSSFRALISAIIYTLRIVKYFQVKKRTEVGEIFLHLKFKMLKLACKYLNVMYFFINIKYIFSDPQDRDLKYVILIPRANTNSKIVCKESYH